MKLVCNSCGIHWPHEFEDTLNSKCTYWKSKDLEDLPKEWKQRVWEWFFSLDWDELLVKENIVIGIDFFRVNKFWKREGEYWVPDESRT